MKFDEYVTQMAVNQEDKRILGQLESRFGGNTLTFAEAEEALSVIMTDVHRSQEANMLVIQEQLDMVYDSMVELGLATETQVAEIKATSSDRLIERMEVDE